MTGQGQPGDDRGRNIAFIIKRHTNDPVAAVDQLL
jgi:hypothetical protein